METFELKSLIKPTTQINVKQFSDRINHEIYYRTAPSCQLDIPQATKLYRNYSKEFKRAKANIKAEL